MSPFYIGADHAHRLTTGHGNSASPVDAGGRSLDPGANDISHTGDGADEAQQVHGGLGGVEELPSRLGVEPALTEVRPGDPGELDDAPFIEEARDEAASVEEHALAGPEDDSVEGLSDLHPDTPVAQGSTGNPKESIT